MPRSKGLANQNAWSPGFQLRDVAEWTCSADVRGWHKALFYGVRGVVFRSVTGERRCEHVLWRTLHGRRDPFLACPVVRRNEERLRNLAHDHPEIGRLKSR